MENTDHLYVTILLKKLKALEKDAKLSRQIMKKLKKAKQYKGSAVGRRLYAMAMLHAPTLGLETLEKVMALSSATFVANLGLGNEHLAAAAAMSPLETHLKNLLINLASEVVPLMSKKTKGKDIPQVLV